MRSILNSPSYPSVHVLFLTFNRLYYTEITLPALLESSENASYKIRIVDNGSTDGTVEYLKKLSHPQIERVIYNRKNEGLVKPTKNFWKESKAEFIGKIDNDILVPKGWIEKLVDAHKKIPDLGVAGLCHFRKEDFNKVSVSQKVEEINGVYIRRQPWIGGNYIMKRSTVLQHREYRQSRKLFQNRILYGFNKFQKKLSEKGYIHGYIANAQKELLLWDHLDDPRHKLFLKDPKYLKKTRNISVADFTSMLKKDAQVLLEDYNVR